MAGLPRITAEGTLVGDPELRFTPAGIPVTKYRIACNERIYDKHTGQWRDGTTTYLTGSVWRELGETVAAELHKGDHILVTGSLRMREWEQDGTRRVEYEIDTAAIAASVRAPKANRSVVPTGDTTDNDPPF